MPPLEYFHEIHYTACGHTIKGYGSLGQKTDIQFRLGTKVPRILVNDDDGACGDCCTLYILDRNKRKIHTRAWIPNLREEINRYLVKLDEYDTELQRCKELAKKKDDEIKQLKGVNSTLKEENSQHVFESSEQPRENLEKDLEIKRLQKTIASQGAELGKLRKQFKENNQQSKESPTSSSSALQNLALQTPPAKGRAAQNPNLQPLGTPTKNPLPAQTPDQQDTIREKKLKLIATMGYINPIVSGFSTLNAGLEEHKWDPFVKSLFTELEEAVRRNDWEEICGVHERMHSFAKAFENDFRERIEKAEEEIIKQCEEGVQRLLGAML